VIESMEEEQNRQKQIPRSGGERDKRNKNRKGGVAFADDMVIVAKSAREMKEIMRNLGKVCGEEKPGSECREDENDGVQQEKEKD
jgi:hypothetical protein